MSTMKELLRENPVEHRLSAKIELEASRSVGAYRDIMAAHFEALKTLADYQRPHVDWPIGSTLVDDSDAEAYITLIGGPRPGYTWDLLSAFVTPADPKTSVANVRTILYITAGGQSQKSGLGATPHPTHAKDFTDAFPDFLDYGENKMVLSSGQRIVFRLTGTGVHATLASTNVFASAIVLEKPVSLTGLHIGHPEPAGEFED